MTPDAKDVHIDAALSNVSLKYHNAEFVGEKLFTSVGVNKDSNIFFKYGKQDFRVFNTIRAAGTRSKQVEWKIEKSDPYFTQEHSLEMQLIDEVRDNADDPIKYDSDSTEIVTQMLLLDLEKTLADAAQDTANFGSGQFESLSGAGRWSDYTNSNPISKVSEMKEAIRSKIFIYPNTMIVAAKVHAKLKEHPKVLERLSHHDLKVTTAELLAQLFEVEKYYVAGGAYDAAAEGQAESMTELWGKSVVLAYVAPNPGIKQISFAYLFRRNGFRLVERWRDNPVKSDWIRIADKYDPKSIAPYAGYLLKTVVD